MQNIAETFQENSQTTGFDSLRAVMQIKCECIKLYTMQALFSRANWQNVSLWKISRCHAEKYISRGFLDLAGTVANSPKVSFTGKVYRGERDGRGTLK